MSSWTHIHATINVDFGNMPDYYIYDFFWSKCRDTNYTLYYDKDAKGSGCEITGSELNAVIVAVPDRNFEKNPDNIYFHGQEWTISINGSLRDREFHETLSEWQRFAWKLAWFVHHDAKRMSGFNYKYDNTISFPRITYYNVDITGYGDDEYYHRCSIKRKSTK